MSEGCNGNCESCAANCSDRTQESLLAKANPMSNVKKVIAVVSGKGGVGKSTVTSMLAVAMHRKGFKTAVWMLTLPARPFPRPLASPPILRASRKACFLSCPGKELP